MAWGAEEAIKMSTALSSLHSCQAFNANLSHGGQDETELVYSVTSSLFPIMYSCKSSVTQKSMEAGDIGSHLSINLLNFQLQPNWK